MDLQKVQEIIGYKFKDTSLLEVALTHSSFSNENPGAVCYERIEFLGDSILAFVSSRFIYESFPDMTEGAMTKLRSTVVCEQTLAKAMGNEIYSHLRVSLGSDRSDHIRVSILADVFEAISAAILLDSNIENAKKFILTRLSAIITEYKNQGVVFDYKSLFQEHIQSGGVTDIAYEMKNVYGPEHEKVFTMLVKVGGKTIAEGTGRSKKEASQEAAKNALKKMKVQL